MIRTLLLALIVFVYPDRVLADPILIGDSIGVGVGMHMPDGRNAVVVGARADNDWSRRVGNLDGKTVVVFLGTNEYDMIDLPNRVHTVVSLLLFRNAGRILWVGPPCSNHAVYDRQFHRTNKVLIQSIYEIHRSGLDISYLNLYDRKSLDGACLLMNRQPDQIHFTHHGYGEIADLVRQTLR